MDTQDVARRWDGRILVAAIVTVLLFSVGVSVLTVQQLRKPEPAPVSTRPPGYTGRLAVPIELRAVVRSGTRSDVCPEEPGTTPSDPGPSDCFVLERGLRIEWVDRLTMEWAKATAQSGSTWRLTADLTDFDMGVYRELPDITKGDVATVVGGVVIYTRPSYEWDSPVDAVTIFNADTPGEVDAVLRTLTEG